MKKKVVGGLLLISMSMLCGCAEVIGMDNVVSTSISKGEQMNVSSEYTLVWEDHFDGNELNREDWNYELHEPGWVNNELQEYVDSEENIYVKDGILTIQAIKSEDEKGNTIYTSGRVNTQNKHDYKYGRFEARVKVPSGKGFLPAFWMMPTNENLYGQWPKCGEIDIMEVLGSETNKSHATLHFGEPHTQKQGKYTLNEGDFSEEFHVFACEWEPGEMRFYVDGELFFSENDWFSKREGFDELTYPAPYDQPFYMILNLAVGGNWPGNPDETTSFDENAQLQVDYVRVYQKSEYDENVSKVVKELVFRESDTTGNYIVNGEFAEDEKLDDAEVWSFLIAEQGDATAKISDHALCIETSNAGVQDYSVQVVQPNLPMENGYRYKVSFDAHAQEPRTMKVAVSAPDKNYIRYMEDTSVELTTEMKSYEYEFDMKADSDINGRLEFNLGNQDSTSTVVISNVRVEKVVQLDTNNHRKTVLPDGNYVYNGSFDRGEKRLAHWTIASEIPEVKSEVTNTDNVRELKICVPDGATDMKQVTVTQDGLSMSGNKDYVLSFSGYADTTETIQVSIAGQLFDVAMTPNKGKYKFVVHTDTELADHKVQFLLGVPGTFYLDDVCVQENSMLVNGDFTNGFVGYEIYAHEETNVNYGVDSLSESDAASFDVSNTGSQDWMIQLKQNNIILEEGKWYKISFDAKASIDRKIMYALQRDGSSDNDWTPYSGSNIIDLTSEYQTYEKTFQMMNTTDEKTILSISMGAVAGINIPEKHTIFIDNILIEEVQ
ncbi:MAG: glycosyl hydrolase family protein [Cellulosilyticum sp.]|nr:glycosyl hydrolase family protein [Cellulosilyticum sp.]